MRHISQHKFITFFVCIVLGFLAFVLYNTYNRATSKPVLLDQSLINKVDNKTYERIVLAGGCFWCTESEYDHVPGVISAVSGYADTEKMYTEGKGPTYQEVSSEQVVAREAVQVIYDPKLITTAKILEIYFKHIDPTDGEGQFADRGHQYTPAIYYTTDEQQSGAVSTIKKIDTTKKFPKKVAVAVLPYKNFYPAEEYHQKYKEKNPVRYNLYREGSGRNAFVRENWGDTSTFIQEIFGTDANQSATIQTSTTSPLQVTKTSKKSMDTSFTASWKNFTPEMKEARLKELTPLQFNVTQKEGTESPFANEYESNKAVGLYVDIVSGEPLFLSKDKYDSGTGWPSFVKPLSSAGMTLHEDKGFFSTRTEVRSKVADSHLGHVFDDGPADRGGKRYCMNSASLRFVPIEDMEKEGYGEFVSLLK